PTAWRPPWARAAWASSCGSLRSSLFALACRLCGTALARSCIPFYTCNEKFHWYVGARPGSIPHQRIRRVTCRYIRHCLLLAARPRSRGSQLSRAQSQQAGLTHPLDEHKCLKEQSIPAMMKRCVPSKTKERISPDLISNGLVWSFRFTTKLATSRIS